MKSHTRHSRRGFYPDKEKESALPGLLYVASDRPESEVKNGFGISGVIDSDYSGVNEIKCGNEERKISTESVEKLVEKGGSETANGGNLRTCSTLHTFCSKFVYSKNLIFFRHLTLKAMFFLRFFKIPLLLCLRATPACAKLCEIHR
ncbi:MAG TPA: hypothetical protein VKC34_17965 [Blastocatellia bacterium]|nr:hypothetical protein [Blastocatellia bacterium]